MRLSYVALLALAATLTGCTAGVYVDENFKPYPIDLPTTFVLLDAKGDASQMFTYTPNGTSADVSFDPYVPTTNNVDGSGIANVNAVLPEGNYYMFVMVPVPGGVQFLSSPVFTHSYYSTCTDHFTGAENIKCAPYAFQAFIKCHNWECVNGTSSPPVSGSQGTHVVPMIVVPDLPIFYAGGPGLRAPGQIPPNW
jgi:hypothetical protein